MKGLEPPYEEIWDGLCNADLIPLLGAGAVRGRGLTAPWNGEDPAWLPSGAELARYLARRVNFPEEEGSDDLGKVADYYRVAAGRGRLRDRLRRIFAREYPYAPLHELLARVPAPLLIVTTNYDDLLERALRAVGRPFDLVVHPTDNEDWAASVLHWRHSAGEPEYVAPKRLEIDLGRTTVIYKMHGAVDPQDSDRDSYVIGDDDYVDFMVRMATQTAIPAIFAEPFRTRSFLFLGYSLRDWNLRVLLSKFERDLRRADEDRRTSWSIQYRPSPLEQELWRKRDVNIYDVALADFVESLQRVGLGRILGSR
jgi:hypothetical protein